MKYFLLITLFFQGLSFLQGQTVPEKFNAQIEESCREIQRISKRVQSVEAGTDETRKFKLNCEAGTATDLESGAEVNFSFPREFVYAFEYYYGTPSMKDYFDVVESEDSVSANLKEKYIDKTPLQSQVIHFNPGNGSIKSVKTILLKDEWLYDLRVVSEVYFDKSGIYDHHQLSTENDVIISGKTTTLINGKRLK